jgi:cyclic beta-1,2-glucan synthetase
MDRECGLDLMARFLKQIFATFHSPQSEVEQPPLRAEIFSVERLEQYAQTLAREHKIVLRKGRPQLLPHLEDNAQQLEATYRTLVDTISEGRAISPAGEWLVDNYHIVEEQLREIRHDLPRGYYQELPKLAGGPLEDYPRIYAVALALIAHTDSRLDTNTLRRFISSYQTVAPLTIGELWAVAITLRLALVENLRRLAVAVIHARAERDEADKLADRLLELASRQPAGIMTLVQEKLGKREHIPQTLVVQLVQRLREQHPSVMPVMDWLRKSLQVRARTSNKSFTQSISDRQQLR